MRTITQLWRKLLQPVDNFLNHITSYRLVLYFLYAIVGWAIIAASFNQLHIKPQSILLSVGFLIAVCRGVDIILSKFLDIPRNKESDLITALILALIITPAASSNDFVVLTISGAAAMASKYILVINKWHIFNPAAFGAVVVGMGLHHYASWWVGTTILTPVVVAGGLLVSRKMKRYTMTGVFFGLTFIVFWVLESGINVHNTWLLLTASPLLFFAFVMLLEPLTSPRKRSKYIVYSLFVAVLYSYTKFGISPEQALLLGNILTYLIEPNRRMQLKFVRKIREANGIESFVFRGSNRFKYQAGQYLEWTLAQQNSDKRGNRRYLTLSSSPTEKELMFTVRLPKPESAFKQRLESLKPGDFILGAQLSGEFILPEDESQKLAFLAGGIGVTPYRSIIKYLVDTGQKRDIKLLYAANSAEEIAFKNLFSKAKEIGVNSFYVAGKDERIDAKFIKSSVPDFTKRMFYVSGPYGFVHAMRGELESLNVPSSQIKTDYFPGYS